VLSEKGKRAAKMTNRYGRTPTHFLALNQAIPSVFLPAMLKSLLDCDSSVLFAHALATVDTVDKGGVAVRRQHQRHRTPLHCVLERPDLVASMVTTCVDKEPASAREVDYFGNTPLHTLLLRRDLGDDVITGNRFIDNLGNEPFHAEFIVFIECVLQTAL